MADRESVDRSERIDQLRETASERWGDDEIDAVVDYLDHDDPAERARAAWALAELAADDDHVGRIPVESGLAPLLDDDARWVRRGASWALSTVADERPGRVKPAVSSLTDSLADDDPLVRENGVLTVSSVAEEYPRAAEPALSKLAELADDDEGLARRYAAETLQRLVRELEDDGYPFEIRAPADVADALPTDSNLVAVSEDNAEGSLQVEEPGAGSAVLREVADEEDDSDDTDDRRALGPPETIPEPLDVAADVDRRDLEPLGPGGEGPLTTIRKARIGTAGEGGQHAVVAHRTLRSDRDVSPVAVESAFDDWADIDDHDHVLGVLARGKTPRPWAAVEFADAGSLADYLGDWHPVRSLWVLHRVTRAVCHAHGHGVLHGALRPGAVELSSVLGAWSVPKVADWGLGDPLGAVRTVPVPVGYAAPEHVDPERFGGPDQATDVYLLGATAYAMFAGRPPFTSERRAVAEDIVAEGPPPVSEVATGVPEGLEDLLDRALAREKSARLETVVDFRHELELLLAEKSLPFEV